MVWTEIATSLGGNLENPLFTRGRGHPPSGRTMSTLSEASDRFDEDAPATARNPRQPSRVRASLFAAGRTGRGSGRAQPPPPPVGRLPSDLDEAARDDLDLEGTLSPVQYSRHAYDSESPSRSRDPSQPKGGVCVCGPQGGVASSFGATNGREAAPRDPAQAPQGAQGPHMEAQAMPASAFSAPWRLAAESTGSGAHQPSREEQLRLELETYAARVAARRRESILSCALALPFVALGIRGAQLADASAPLAVSCFFLAVIDGAVIVVNLHEALRGAAACVLLPLPLFDFQILLLMRVPAPVGAVRALPCSLPMWVTATTWALASFSAALHNHHTSGWGWAAWFLQRFVSACALVHLCSLFVALAIAIGGLLLRPPPAASDELGGGSDARSAPHGPSAPESHAGRSHGLRMCRTARTARWWPVVAALRAVTLAVASVLWVAARWHEDLGDMSAPMLAATWSALGAAAAGVGVALGAELELRHSAHLRSTSERTHTVDSPSNRLLADETPRSLGSASTVSLALWRAASWLEEHRPLPLQAVVSSRGISLVTALHLLLSSAAVGFLWSSVDREPPGSLGRPVLATSWVCIVLLLVDLIVGAILVGISVGVAEALKSALASRAASARGASANPGAPLTSAVQSP